jgi:hypothetical protein
VNDLPTRGPVLAVSLHLDDAMMAVGATLVALVEAGREAIVCTVFAGVPEPPFLARGCGVPRRLRPGHRRSRMPSGRRCRAA